MEARLFPNFEVYNGFIYLFCSEDSRRRNDRKSKWASEPAGEIAGGVQTKTGRWRKLEQWWSKLENIILQIFT